MAPIVRSLGCGGFTSPDAERWKAFGPGVSFVRGEEGLGQVVLMLPDLDRAGEHS